MLSRFCTKKKTRRENACTKRMVGPQKKQSSLLRSYKAGTLNGKCDTFVMTATVGAINVIFEFEVPITLQL